MSRNLQKPVPVPTEIDKPYWEALQERRVVLCRCTSCGWFYQRRPMLCLQCLGETFAWSDVSGRGTIYAFTEVHKPWVASFADDLPYVLVSVALEEQSSLVLVTNLVGDFDYNDLELGLPVVADFEPRGDQTLLQFRLQGDDDVQS